MVSIDREKPVAGRLNIFLSKVMDAYRDMIVKQTSQEHHQQMVLLVLWMVGAYSEKSEAVRAAKIDQLVEAVEMWGIGKLTDQQVRKLKAGPPKYIGKGKRAALAHSLDNASTIFSYSKTDYYRHLKKFTAFDLEKEILIQYGNNLNFLEVFGVISRTLLGLDSATSSGIYELLKKRAYDSSKVPLNNSLALFKRVLATRGARRA